MNILQEIGVLDEAGTEIVEFIDGQATTLPSFSVAGKTWTLTAQKFGATPPPAPFQEFNGSLENIIGLALLDGSEVAAGAPVSLGFKVVNTYYGVTITSATA